MIDETDDKIIRMRDYARSAKIPAIHDEGLKILLDTVREIKPRFILEIGTAIGYSGTAMLNAAPEDCVLDTIEADKARYEAAVKNFKDAGLGKKANCILGDCIEELPRVIEGKTYDLIFIDAAKSKYLDCLKMTENNLSANGAVVADNVYFRGMVTGQIETPRKYRAIVKNLRKFIEYIGDKQKFNTVIYDKGDGVAVIKKIKITDNRINLFY